MKTPLILGHRGAPHAAIENTRASFLAALAQGADGVELDVRLASCGTPIVCHDDTLQRWTGRATRVAKTSAWALSREDLGDQSSIITLSTALELLAHHFVNIEIKTDDGDPAALAHAVSRCMSNHHHVRQRVIVSSFDPRTLNALKRIAPSIARGLLIEPTPTAPNLSSSMLRAVQPQAIHPHWSAGPERIRQLKSSGFDVHVWTVDDPTLGDVLASSGATSLITNVPAAMIAHRQSA
ncbi:MAG: glycerophosphodiester phosphodiesterase family protein [Deltaproteobacteria bacterium]|nr:glycerophosphodiester phosphodiesterase family protein [Deltaproteobacteria bacterium]